MNSLENYLKLFVNATDEQFAIGEGSTTYLQSKVAIERILDFNPDSKIIVMLRNPVEVAYAMHGELLRQLLEDEVDFQTAWNLQEARADGRCLPRRAWMRHQLQYREVVAFGQQVERVSRCVPAQNLKVVMFEDFVSNTPCVYDDVLRFLCLEPFKRHDFSPARNAQVARFPVLAKLAYDPPGFLLPAAKGVRKWLSARDSRLKQTVRKIFLRDSARRALAEDFRRQLNREFRSEVERLSSLLNRDLTAWTDGEPSSA